ncbi:MAG: phytanoyl-CoA dioxygenase family protein [Bryobacteraceae bacterium]|nr:phytanoyl-CoA dioxygenase family protein [Bryobacteraceae bacterium]
MIWVFVLSGGKRVFMDQNCTMKLPKSYKPLIQTRPEWQFSEEEIKSFYENGFIGPITLWTPEEMEEIREKVTRVLDRPSKVYPNAENQLRDRYIDCPEFWEVISAPQLKERLAQLLGPDLLVWRSQIFNKMPGGPEITWHQASTYMAEQKIKATLEPRHRNELFQLTTWIAIDDAFFENGCMHFLKGTHRKMWTMVKGGNGYIGNPPEVAKIIGGYGRFAKSSGLTLEVPITEDMIVPMPLKSGQCVIFTERCIHGSPPNVSDKRRFGFVFRTIRTDVKVYRDETKHDVTYLNESFDLQNWGCALLRGEDEYRLNKMIQPPQYEREMTAA